MPFGDSVDTHKIEVRRYLLMTYLIRTNDNCASSLTSNVIFFCWEFIFGQPKGFVDNCSRFFPIKFTSQQNCQKDNK